MILKKHTHMTRPFYHIGNILAKKNSHSNSSNRELFSHMKNDSNIHIQRKREKKITTSRVQNVEAGKKTCCYEKAKKKKLSQCYFFQYLNFSYLLLHVFFNLTTTPRVHENTKRRELSNISCIIREREKKFLFIKTENRFLLQKQAHTPRR